MGLLRSSSSLLLSGLALLAIACSEQTPAPAASDAASGRDESAAAAPGGPSPEPPAAATATPALPTPTPTPAPRAGLVPTGPPPRLDRSIASVDLEDVVFDTFRGSVLPLLMATDEQIELLRDAISPIYEPTYDTVDPADWLWDTDLVIGYVSQSGAFAYPIKILNFRELVNDVIDGVPVLVSYCPLCFSGVVYSRELDGQVLLFGNTSALYESDLVMYDHQTGSYWFQVLGEALVGPMTGKRLTLLPSMTTTWGEWRRMHPETVALSNGIEAPDDIGQPLGSPYDRDPFAGYASSLNQGRFAFPVSTEKLDDRLRPGDKVFAIEVGGRHKAYALTADSDWVVNEVVGGERVVVMARAQGPNGQ